MVAMVRAAREKGKGRSRMTAVHDAHDRITSVRP
jgi:hypothetical protein